MYTANLVPDSLKKVTSNNHANYKSSLFNILNKYLISFRVDWISDGSIITNQIKGATMFKCESCPNRNRNLENHGTRWTFEEEFQLTSELLISGPEYLSEIAEKLGRSELAILIRMAKRGFEFEGCKKIPQVKIFNLNRVCFTKDCIYNKGGFYCLSPLRVYCSEKKEAPCKIKRKAPSADAEKKLKEILDSLKEAQIEIKRDKAISQLGDFVGLAKNLERRRLKEELEEQLEERKSKLEELKKLKSDIEQACIKYNKIIDPSHSLIRSRITSQLINKIGILVSEIRKIESEIREL